MRYSERMSDAEFKARARAAFIKWVEDCKVFYHNPSFTVELPTFMQNEIHRETPVRINPERIFQTRLQMMQ